MEVHSRSDLDVEASRDRLARYLMFTVGLSLLPLFGVWLLKAYDGAALGVDDLAKGGEPLVISLVLTAEGLSGLIASDRQRVAQKYVTALGGFVVIMSAAGIYALSQIHPPGNPSFFRWFSLANLLAGLLSAVSCKILEFEQ
jgi:hypothetical protein